MNRRNVLVGLGTIVAGGGAALGTGAFSSVEATRTVAIGVADDSNALLAIEVAEDYQGDAETEADQAQVDLANPGNADGLNAGAATTFEGLVAITNQGTNPVEIGYDGDLESDGIELIPEVHENYDGENFEENGPANGNSGGTSDDYQLNGGETLVLDVTFDIGDTEASEFDIDVTLTATETA